jgi:uncharacterized membrane protein YphA (DoxX/SURF4 family)
MSVNSRETAGGWISRLLRLAVTSLFFAAAAGKWHGGSKTISQTFDFFQKTFEGTWLPDQLVTIHFYVTLFIEPLLVLWLIIGLALPLGWIVATLFMISLAFGMSVAGQHATASNNYIYVLIFCVGLYFSQFDSWRLSRLWSKRSKP